MFRITVVKNGDNYSGEFFLLVDGQRVFVVEEYSLNVDPSPQGSATINLYLTAGQLVQVENSASTLLWGTNASGFLYSWITGFLFYAFR